MKKAHIHRISQKFTGFLKFQYSTRSYGIQLDLIATGQFSCLFEYTWSALPY